MGKLVLTALATALLAAPVNAAVVYSNNFDAENGGNSALNFNGFSGLTVSDGTVDLIRSGSFGITCSGGAGSCVDLDGSTGNSGVLSSAGSFGFASGDTVTLGFDFSGNQRGGANDNVFIRFLFAGATSGTYGFSSTNGGGVFDLGPFSNQTLLELPGTDFASDFPLEQVTFFFTATNGSSVSFNFEDLGNDNVGPIIDNLVLEVTPVPEPETWAMMIAGFGLVGAGLRRRRTRIAFA